MWKKEGCDDLELTRRLIDLFFVSVLLDAGAGHHWRYIETETDQTYERSEGIAVASFHMFKSLAFTAAKSEKVPVVDGNDYRFIRQGFSLTVFICREGFGSVNDRCIDCRLSSVG